ncbi:MAG: PCRF domain-containing protein, partial [Dethiobacteria bacterium]
MWEKLKTLEDYFNSLETKLSAPEIIKDQQQWQKYAREHAGLSELVESYRLWRKTNGELQEAREMSREKLDDEMLSYLREEISELTKRKEKLEDDLKILLLPKDPNDEKDVIIEIRAGTGGDEAALFAADLLRMYLRFAERQGWGMEVLNSSPTDIGGMKEIVF